MNDLTTPGTYFLTADKQQFSNVPAEIPNNCRSIIEVKKAWLASSTYYIVQELTYAVGDDIAITYKRQNDGGTWKAWTRLDNFGCSTPGALASLLGGLKYLNWGADANTVSVGLSQYGGADTSLCHIPVQNGVLASLVKGNCGLQFFFNNSNFWIRYVYNNTIGEWIQQ